jgi:RNA polymerase sigma-70 factor (ECF subfamily)
MGNGASSYRRFLDGDDQGIAEIVGEHKDGLILYLNGYVNNIFLAEDLAEETFFRLVVKKPAFSGRSTFRSFLYAIGRNVTVDYIRHHKNIAPVSVEELQNSLSEQQNLEQAYIKEERQMAIRRALSNLSSDYQSVLWLTYFEGFSNREAAVTLKKNNRQITNLLYRAKQALKNELEKEGVTYENL